MWRNRIVEAAFSGSVLLMACATSMPSAPVRSPAPMVLERKAPEDAPRRAETREELRAELERREAALAAARRELDLRGLEERVRAEAAREARLARAVESSETASPELERVRAERAELEQRRAERIERGELAGAHAASAEIEALAQREAVLVEQESAQGAFQQELAEARSSLGELRAELVERSAPSRREGLERRVRELERHVRTLRARIDADEQAEHEAELALRRLHARGLLVRDGDRWVVTLPSDAVFGPTGAVSAMAFEPLRCLASALRLVPDATLSIEVHGDGLGSREHSARATQRRAAAVRRFLAQQGVRPDRVRAVGRGLEAPRAPGADREARTQNARVEIALSMPDVEAIARRLPTPENETPAEEGGRSEQVASLD